MDLKKMQGNYIGRWKIKYMVASDKKTLLGKEKVIVHYENRDTPDEMPLEVFSQIATKEESNDTELREKWVTPVAEKILVLVTEAEIRKRDIEYLMGIKVTESLNVNARRAYEKLLGKDRDDLTMMDFEEMLRGEIKLIRDKNHDKKRGKGTG